jgi:mannose-1-phosphate guanylyltransferase
MNKNYYAIIMAGGIGSRFWPISRTSHPKQFIDILGTGKTLIQQTYDRFLKVCPKENIFVVTNETYTDLVKSQLPDMAGQPNPYRAGNAQYSPLRGLWVI